MTQSDNCQFQVTGRNYKARGEPWRSAMYISSCNAFWAIHSAGQNRQFLTQLSTSAKYASFGGRLCNAQLLGDLLVRPTLSFVEKKGASQRGIQTQHGLRCEFAIDVLALVVASRVLQFRASMAAGIHAADIDAIVLVTRAIPSQSHERFIEGHAKQPGRKP